MDAAYPIVIDDVAYKDGVTNVVVPGRLQLNLNDPGGNWPTMSYLRNLAMPAYGATGSAGLSRLFRPWRVAGGSDPQRVSSWTARNVRPYPMFLFRWLMGTEEGQTQGTVEFVPYSLTPDGGQSSTSAGVTDPVAQSAGVTDPVARSAGVTDPVAQSAKRARDQEDLARDAPVTPRPRTGAPSGDYWRRTNERQQERQQERERTEVAAGEHGEDGGDMASPYDSQAVANTPDPGEPQDYVRHAQMAGACPPDGGAGACPPDGGVTGGIGAQGEGSDQCPADHSDPISLNRQTPHSPADIHNTIDVCRLDELCRSLGFLSMTDRLSGLVGNLVQQMVRLGVQGVSPGEADLTPLEALEAAVHDYVQGEAESAHQAQQADCQGASQYSVENLQSLGIADEVMGQGEVTVEMSPIARPFQRMMDNLEAEEALEREKAQTQAEVAEATEAADLAASYAAYQQDAHVVEAQSADLPEEEEGEEEEEEELEAQSADQVGEGTPAASSLGEDEVAPGQESVHYSPPPLINAFLGYQNPLTPGTVTHSMSYMTFIHLAQQQHLNVPEWTPASTIGMGDGTTIAAITAAIQGFDAAMQTSFWSQLAALIEGVEPQTVGSALAGLAGGPDGYVMPSYIDGLAQTQVVEEILGPNAYQLDAWIQQFGQAIQRQLDHMQTAPPPLPSFAGVAQVTGGRVNSIVNGLGLRPLAPTAMNIALAPYVDDAFHTHAIRAARNAYSALRIAREIGLIEAGIDTSELAPTYLTAGDELAFLANCGMLAEVFAAPVFGMNSLPNILNFVRQWLTGVPLPGTPPWTANGDESLPRRQHTAFLGSCLRILFAVRRGRGGGNVAAIVLIGVGAYDIASQLAIAFSYSSSPIPNPEGIERHGFRNMWVTSLEVVRSSMRLFLHVIQRLTCMLAQDRSDVLGAHAEELSLRALRVARLAAQEEAAAAARQAAIRPGGRAPGRGFAAPRPAGVPTTATAGPRMAGRCPVASGGGSGSGVGGGGPGAPAAVGGQGGAAAGAAVGGQGAAVGGQGGAAAGAAVGGQGAAVGGQGGTTLAAAYAAAVGGQGAGRGMGGFAAVGRGAAARGRGLGAGGRGQPPGRGGGRGHPSEWLFSQEDPGASGGEGNNGGRSNGKG